MQLFYLDFETTGLSPYLNDIIEIAIKKHGDDNHFQTIVKPNKMPRGSLYMYVPPDINKLTGITDTMIHEEGIENSVATYHMFKFIVDNSNLEEPIYIVSHNGTTFDFLFFRKMVLNYMENKCMGIDKDIFERIQYIDTILLARSFPKHKWFSQKKLCESYNITNESEHRAYGDITALEKLYICLCKDYAKYMKKEEGYYLENPESIKQFT